MRKQLPPHEQRKMKFQIKASWKNKPDHRDTV